MCSACPSGPSPRLSRPNLWAAQVDTRGRLEQGWSAIRDYLTGLLAARGMAEVQAEELTVLPGAEEIVALLEVRRWAVDGRFDAILVDCAPSGETLRLLALPGDHRVLRRPADGRPAPAAAHPGRVPHRRCARRWETARSTMRSATCSTDLTAARTLLADPAFTGVRLVLTAGAGGHRRGQAAAHRAVPARLPGRRGGGQPAAPGRGRRRVPGRRREAETAAVHLVNESFAGSADAPSAARGPRADRGAGVDGAGRTALRNRRPAGVGRRPAPPSR